MDCNFSVDVLTPEKCFSLHSCGTNSNAKIKGRGKSCKHDKITMTVCNSKNGKSSNYCCRNRTVVKITSTNRRLSVIVPALLQPLVVF